MDSANSSPAERLLAEHPNREMRLLGSIATGLKNAPKAEGAPYADLAVREENIGSGKVSCYLDVFMHDGELWTIRVEKLGASDV